LSGGCWNGITSPASGCWPEPGWPSRRRALLAITGPSGSGKSTVARLLLRFRDPYAGRILLDGIDVRELTLHTLRYNVTLLTQEALLFPGTIADNIRYGRTGASDDEVAAAARAADAHAFITALPGGYDTPVGQRGRLLFGGQRQRICLARVFLRDAPVLVLDEPTTGLDEASAQRLLAMIRRFAASHTVILITHDPRMTAAADTVLRLASRQPQEQARDWPGVPSPLAEVPASALTTNLYRFGVPGHVGCHLARRSVSTGRCAVPGWC
jgi:ATP-binding cassette subfamily B protein